MKKYLLIALFLLSSCSSANKDDVKDHAAKVFKQAGFEIIGYEGYQFGFNGLFGYGGACVWYSLKRIPDNGIFYDACIQKWGSEYHIYNLHAVDAIKPK